MGDKTQMEHEKKLKCELYTEIISKTSNREKQNIYA